MGAQPRAGRRFRPWWLTPDANIDTKSTVDTFIDADVRIKSTRGVDIGAFHRNVTADRHTESDPIAFIPIPINRGDRAPC
jgi:hypothetical protein